MRQAERWALLLILGSTVSCAAVITEKNREAARIKYDLGVTSLNRGENRVALRELLSAVDLDADLPEAHNALALVFHNLGRTDDALKHYTDAVRLNPKFTEAWNNLGTLYVELHRYDEAIAAFKTCLNDLLYATPSLAEGNMGWAYYQKGNIDDAMMHIGNAVATNPQFCRGYEWLTRIALEQNRPADVVANGKRFQKYCVNDATIGSSLTPEYLKEMQYYLALGHLKQGNRDAARQMLALCAIDSDGLGFADKCAQSLRSLQGATRSP